MVEITSGNGVASSTILVVSYRSHLHPADRPGHYHHQKKQRPRTKLDTCWMPMPSFDARSKQDSVCPHGLRRLRYKYDTKQFGDNWVVMLKAL